MISIIVSTLGLSMCSPECRLHISISKGVVWPIDSIGCRQGDMMPQPPIQSDLAPWLYSIDELTHTVDHRPIHLVQGLAWVQCTVHSSVDISILPVLLVSVIFQYSVSLTTGTTELDRESRLNRLERENLALLLDGLNGGHRKDSINPGTREWKCDDWKVALVPVISLSVERPVKQVGD